MKKSVISTVKIIFQAVFNVLKTHLNIHAQSAQMAIELYLEAHASNVQIQTVFLAKAIHMFVNFVYLNFNLLMDYVQLYVLQDKKDTN